jgi:hypothetical protein
MLWHVLGLSGGLLHQETKGKSRKEFQSVILTGLLESIPRIPTAPNPHGNRYIEYFCEEENFLSDPHGGSILSDWRIRHVLGFKVTTP